MDEDFLNIDEGAVLLRIARDSLYDWVRSGERAALDGYELTPHLRERHGAFVTLRRGGGLRGGWPVRIFHFRATALHSAGGRLAGEPDCCEIEGVQR